MDYISYKEAETLFEVWPMLQHIKKSIVAELKIIENISTDELIYTLSVGNKVLDGLPIPKHSHSSTTENVALNYKENIDKQLSKSRTDIKKDIVLLCIIDEKLKISYTSLSKLQQNILEKFYWRGLTWAEVLSCLDTDKEYLSKYQAQTIRTDAIRKIAITSRINLKMYNDIMEIIGKGK